MIRTMLPLFLVCFGMTFLPTSEAEDRPNLIVIMADDLGWRDLHCYGSAAQDSPALDQLAKEGMRFTDAYAASPVCSPTRASMMTGLAPARLHLTNHAPGNKDGFALEGSDLAEPETVRNLALSYTTIAERLKAEGYVTAHIGKWHLSYQKRNQVGGVAEEGLRPEHQGFEHNIGGNFRGGPPSYFSPYRNPALEDGPEGEYLPERLANEAIEFIRKERDEPFFLSWWPYSVHYPIEAPEALVKKYEARSGLRDATYAAMIEGMDRGIGRFLKALDEAGLRDDTLVIFKSDNGGYNGNNRPLRGFKGMITEGGIRIPWIVRWPGVVPAGATCETPVISMDCVPTLLEAAGIDPASAGPFDGLSLMPLLTQQGQFDRDTLFFHYPNYAFHKRNRLASAVRWQNFKFIRRYDDGSRELYDLSQDIGEKRNLAGNRPRIVEQLDGQLANWLEEVDARLPVNAK